MTDIFSEIQRKLDIHEKLMHDMKNHFCAIDILVGNGMLKEAREYVAEFLPELHNTATVGLSGSVISVILYSKRVAAKEKHIHLRCGIGVSNIAIPLHDLNGIISNMLDNAIEACEKITNRKKRQIFFRVYVEGESVIIECENTYSEKIQLKSNGVIATTKRDYMNHGYGLRRIEDYAKKTVETFKLNDKGR